MTVHFQEQGTLITFSEQTLAATTATVTPYVNASQCDATELVALLAANGTATAADQVKFDVLAASDEEGAGAEVVKFQYVYVTVGAPAIKDGTGRPAKTVFTNSTGGNEKRDDYTTTEADGNKELQVTIPIRERQLPQGKVWLALRMTTGANARDATNVVMRCNESYGADIASNLHLLNQP